MNNKDILDHVGARWDGLPISSQSALLDADDGAVKIQDSMKEDQEAQPKKTCTQQIIKVNLSIFAINFFLVHSFSSLKLSKLWFLNTPQKKFDRWKRQHLISVHQNYDTTCNVSNGSDWISLSWCMDLNDARNKNRTYGSIKKACSFNEYYDEFHGG